MTAEKKKTKVKCNSIKISLVCHSFMAKKELNTYLTSIQHKRTSRIFFFILRRRSLSLCWLAVLFLLVYIHFLFTIPFALFLKRMPHVQEIRFFSNQRQEKAKQKFPVLSCKNITEAVIKPFSRKNFAEKKNRPSLVFHSTVF